jgi:hypothetical protein
MAPTIWLVTGTTSGIGAALIDHIVARGDKLLHQVEKLSSDSVITSPTMLRFSTLISPPDLPISPPK